MIKTNLIESIKKQKSFLSIGIDPDLQLLPKYISNDLKGIEYFCKKIIENTHENCVSYKLNIAFFEIFASKGMDIFEKIIDFIPNTHFKIIDAKRGDIGNTSKKYAQTYFDYYKCDGVTLSPYMGKDSLSPFFEYKNKYSIVLGMTSNEGSNDFQKIKIGEQLLCHKIMQKCTEWASSENLMFVIGATQKNEMKEIRLMFKDNFFLVPGIGAQNGNLDLTLESLLTNDIGILLTMSRDLLYLSDNSDNFIKSKNKSFDISNYCWNKYLSLIQ